MKLSEAMNDNVSGWAIIRPDHLDIREIDFIEADEEPSLETMQEAVNGYIEHITLNYLVTIYDDDDTGRFRSEHLYEADGLVNEEGKLIGLPPNPIGTAWYGMDGHGDIICGNLMVMFGKARMK